jgi:predicted nucleic acid-binding protein
MDMRGRVLVDTNCVIDIVRGKDIAQRPVARGALVTSVSLHELFGMLGDGWTYKFFPTRYAPDPSLGSARRAKEIRIRGLKRSDLDKRKPWVRHLTFPGMGPFESHYELGHSDIVALYNNLGAKHLEAAFRLSAGRSVARDIGPTVRVLKSLQIRAVALTQESIDLSLGILPHYLSFTNIKQRPRNSLNDVYILAMAKLLDASLVTRDALLSRFAVEAFGWEFHEGVTWFEASPKTRHPGRERRRISGLSRPTGYHSAHTRRG